MNNRIAKNLQALVDNSGLPLTKICKDADVNQSIAYKFLTRTQERITIENLICFANYFNIPISKFWENDDILVFTKEIQNFDINNGEQKAYDYIKFYDVRVSAGSGIPSEAEEFRMLPIEKSFTKKLGHNPEKLTALEVAGDSMEPTLRNGDYVIATYKDFLPNFVPGVYIIKDFSGLKVKRLDMDKKGNLKVIPDNKFYEIQIYSQEELASEQIIILARVVGKIGMM